LKFETNFFDVFKGIYFNINTNQYTDLIDGKISITDGKPANEDDFYKIKFTYDFKAFATFYESGDFLLNGNLYVDSKIDSQGSQSEGILVNRIDNLKNVNKTDITGIPEIIDMEFNFIVEDFYLYDNKIFWTGSDRVHTYCNQEITQFEFYFNDVLTKTLSERALIQSEMINIFSFYRPATYPGGGGGIGIQNFDFTTTLNFKLKLYKTDDSIYLLRWYDWNNTPITFNLQNIIDYRNPRPLRGAILRTAPGLYINKYNIKRGGSVPPPSPCRINTKSKHQGLRHLCLKC